MSVSKEQYEAIENIYRQRRLKAVDESGIRVARIHEEIPELSRLEEARLSLIREQYRGFFQESGKEERQKKLAQLTREKKELLARHGYEEADLLPRYHCPLCRDTGLGEEGECACYGEILNSLTGSQSLSARGASFDDFSLDWYDDKKPLPAFGDRTERRLMEMNLEAARRFVARFDTEKGNLFMTGPVGTGKTLLCRILSEEIRKKGYEVCLLTAQEFFDAAEEKLFDREGGASFSMEQINRAALLVIDDLGTEFTSRRLAQNALFTLINERKLKGQATIISSNLGLGEIGDLYLPRVLSRLAGDYMQLEFVGPDLRLMQKKKAMRS